jgi:hypothetical protein
MKRIIVVLACLAIGASTRADLRKKYGDPIYETYDMGGGGRTIDAPYGSEEFRKKYGEPVSETYQVQSGFIVTATYKTNGQFKELTVASQSSSNSKNSDQDDILWDTFNKSVNELVPLEDRGKHIKNSMGYHVRELNSPPMPGSEEEWEKLTIYHYNGGGVPPFIVIKWKN